MDPTMIAALGQLVRQGMQDKAGGLGSILGELFNDRRQPYADAQRGYDKFFNEGVSKFNPFYNAGVDSIGDFKNWLNGMKDPSEFINKLMGGYQESPYARFSKEQGQNAINNAASNSGLVGSTPYLRESADYAQGVASKDMQDWLARVLGINSEYGGGLGKMYEGGLNSARSMGEMYGRAAGDEGDLAYAKSRAGQERSNGLIGGALKFLL